MSEGSNHLKGYYIVFGALIVATILTVALSYVPMGHATNIVVGVIIAAVKATLVALIFMHLKYEERWIYVIAIFPLILVIWLTFALMPDVGFPIPS